MHRRALPMLALLLSLLLLAPTPAHAAIAFDAECSSHLDAADDSTCTLTVGSLTNGVLLIVVVRAPATSPATPTVNGSSTGVNLWNTVTQDAVIVDVYSKINPSSGSNVIVTAESEILAALSYSGVDQTTPLGTIFEATDAGTALSIEVTGTSAGQIVLGFVGWGSDEGNRTLTPDGSNPARINDPGGGGQADGVAVLEETSGGGTVTLSGTFSVGADWAATGTVLNAAAAPGCKRRGGLMTMGVGC